MTVVLASTSPRRHVLLRYLLDDFQIDAVPVNEVAPRGLPVGDALEVIARKKALAASRKHPDAVVLGADTVVVYRDHLVGKARSEIEIRANMAMLAGEAHHVMTGVALAYDGRALDAEHCSTQVRFDRFPPEVLGKYVASEAWVGKAGGYGIQDPILAPFIHIDGPWSNVVGLPLGTTRDLLLRNDIPCKEPPAESWLRDHNPFDTGSG